TPGGSAREDEGAGICQLLPGRAARIPRDGVSARGAKMLERNLLLPRRAPRPHHNRASRGARTHQKEAKSALAGFLEQVAERAEAGLARGARSLGLAAVGRLERERDAPLVGFDREHRGLDRLADFPRSWLGVAELALVQEPLDAGFELHEHAKR